MKKKIFYLMTSLLFWGAVGSLHAQSGNWKEFCSGQQWAGGNGTITNPYQIKTPAQLAYLAFNVNGGNGYPGFYFRLEDNIDLKEHYWTQIGTYNASGTSSPSFKGHFDGNGKIVRNMIINEQISSLGLFGYISDGATIENLTLESIKITQGSDRCGGLVGTLENSSVISCSVIGSIKATTYVGGLVGHAGNATIKGCYTFMSPVEGKFDFVGGLVGALSGKSTVSSCYSMGTIVGERIVGGLIGQAAGGADDSNKSIITSCYSKMTVLGKKENQLGGLLGAILTRAEINTCLAIGDWIIGTSPLTNRIVGNDLGGVYKNNYALADMGVSYDGVTAPLPISDAAISPENTLNGKGISRNDLNDDDFYDDIDWDKDDEWDKDDNNPPYLKGQSAPVICVNNSTKAVTVKHRLVDTEGKPVTMDKIVLLDSTFVELMSGEDVVVTIKNNEYTYKPKNVTFHVGDTVYAIAYEQTRLPSYPVMIIISPFENGGGGKDTPFEIWTPADLDKMRELPNAHYKIMADLDMKPYLDTKKWEPIGTKEKPFKGGLDGNGHIISDLVVEGPGDYQGLFGNLQGDTIKNLGLENVKITGKNWVGPVAGNSSAVIKNVYTTGQVIATGNDVGGLVGEVSATVEGCYSVCLVKGKNRVGGLLGKTAAITRLSYAGGPVFGDSFVGGLVGDSRLVIENSYSFGFVACRVEEYSGGLVGDVYGKISGCYYDNITSGTGDKGIGLDEDETSERVLFSYRTSDLAKPIFSGTIGASWTQTAGYYPQIKFFAQNSNSKMKSCSAFSVVPIAFVNGETAKQVQSSFPLPAKFPLDNNNDITFTATDSCTVIDAKVVSIRRAGVDTLAIKSVTGNHARKISFIPKHITPTLHVDYVGVINEWTNKNVEYALSNTQNLISGKVKYQNNICPTENATCVNWKDINGTYDSEGRFHNVFDKDTLIALQYWAISGAGYHSQVYPGDLLRDDVKIDKVAPVIKSISTSPASMNPVPEHVTVTVAYEDDRSGVKTAVWEIGAPKIKGNTIENIVNNGNGEQIANVILEQSGTYPFIFTITDKAGNVVDNSKNPLNISVWSGSEDPEKYILDGIIVDGEDAKLKDENNPYVYETTVCVVNETAEVTLTPASAFGIDPFTVTVTDLEFGKDNKREITVTSKDGKVAQTFTIYICRETPVASFMSLEVNGETILLKPNKYDYVLTGKLPYEQTSVVAVYTMLEGEKCDKSPSPYTFTNLPIGRHPIALSVTSADGKTTHTYNIMVTRLPKEIPVPADEFNKGDFVDEPYDKNGNLFDPEGDSPWVDDIDENGNVILGFSLSSYCPKEGEIEKIALNYTLTVEPKPSDATVEFSLMKDDWKTVISSSKRNTYKFDIANYYNLLVTVQPQGVDQYPRYYRFYVVRKFDKSILYPRWDDVRAVINNPDNNGGYLFNQYEWMLTDKDGAFISSLPYVTSYIGVEDSKTYVAKLTGKHTDVNGQETPISQVPTCPCEIKLNTQANILAYPSILKTGEKVTISTENISDVELKGADVSIINSLGSKTGRVSLTGSNTEVAMPDAPGIYLLKVSTKSVTREFKVILK